jgi:hypothetical protein
VGRSGVSFHLEKESILKERPVGGVQHKGIR